MRGEFRFANGRILPNTVTIAGQQQYLQMLFQNILVTQFFMGLTDSIPTMMSDLSTINEPTIGINGYARINVPRSIVGWPNEGSSAGIPFIETTDLVFTPVIGPFDQPVSRIFLTPEQTLTVGIIWAIGAAIPTPIVLDPTTTLVDRTFRYRVYMV